MKFLIISHAFHKQQNGKLYSYAPYVREMNLWLKYVDEVEVLAPNISKETNSIDLEYHHKNIHFNSVPALNFTALGSALLSLLSIPVVIFKLFAACYRADHIHLRCPGNIGLLGCFVQICFPKKIKTAKYAGNWDPNANQPLSYRIQKKMLSNTFWTRNITVLVYGNWHNQSINLKPFYTATFFDSEKEEWQQRDYSKELKLVFIGSLVSGKQPLLAIKIVERLYNNGKPVSLDIFGDGILNEKLQNYISEHNLFKIIKLHGNQPKAIIKDALSKAHFGILPSQSEGWPKAIAEAMFFGVIPIATGVSCVPWMLDNGQRGILIEAELEKAIEKINHALNHKDLNQISKEAFKWSQTYTLDKFDKDIRKLLLQ